MTRKAPVRRNAWGLTEANVESLIEFPSSPARDIRNRTLRARPRRARPPQVQPRRRMVLTVLPRPCVFRFPGPGGPVPPLTGFQPRAVAYQPRVPGGRREVADDADQFPHTSESSGDRRRELVEGPGAGCATSGRRG